MKKTLISIIAIIISVFLINYMRFIPTMNADVDGLLFTSDQLILNLINGDNSKEKINYKTISKDEQIYKQGDNLFVGEKKKYKINQSLPLVARDTSMFLILDDTSKYVDYRFQTASSYPNSALAGGSLYNLSSLEKASDDTYYFLKLESSVFINSLALEVETNKKYSIETSSFIYFDENQIRYYAFKNGKLRYYEINSLDNSSKIKINKKTFTYEEFRILLGLASKGEKEELVTELIDIPETIKKSTSKTNNSENIEKEKIEGTVEYVKPEVSATDFTVGIYSLKSTITINDPAWRIKKMPTFEVKINNSVYLRKSVGVSGEFEITGLLPDTEYTIIGSYTYLNEDDVQVKKTFFNQTIKTNDITNVEDLEFTLENTQSFPHHITISNMGLLNKSSDEVLKGLKKVIIEIGDNKYTLSSSQLSKLKKLSKIDYETPKSLTSNTEYTYYIKAEDIAGNTLTVKNNSYTVKTSKEAPTADIKVVKTDITTATLKTTITNKDNVSMSNLYYVVSDLNGEVIRKDTFDSEKDFKISDLDVNEVYSVEIYADYDLQDGKGAQKNQRLKETKFSTQPLSTLGYVRLEFLEKSMKQDYALYQITLNKDITDDRLVELLDKVVIKITNSSTGEVITKEVKNDDIITLQSGGAVNFEITDLESKTTYTVETITYVKQGNKSYDLKALTNLKEFKTLKKEAEVSVINKFTTENLIDFDAKIIDVDGAIQSDRIRLEVRNSKGILVYVDELKINGDYQRFTLEKLDKEEEYTFTYSAEEYNVGYNNITFEESKVILKESYITNVGIYGDLRLDSLLRQTTSKNLFDIENDSRWKTGGSSSQFNRSINLKQKSFNISAKNGNAIYSYYLPEHKGKTLLVSFYARHSSTSNGQSVYLNGTDSGKQNILNGITTDWKKYDIKIKMTSQYFSFNVSEITNNNTVTTVEIKELQVVDVTNSSVTSLKEYENYKEKPKHMATIYASIYDSKEELMENKFYIQTIMDGKILSTKKYDMTEEHQSVDQILKYELERNKSYEIRLCVKVRDRLYPVTSLYFSTEEEIRTIKTPADFFAVHTNGKYLVANDLDFRSINQRLDIAFSGTLDFQGHKVLLNVQNRPSVLMYKLSASGVVENIDVHYYFDNPKARGSYYGLIQEQEGTVENIKITLEESTNVNNSIISLLCYVNRGTIKNFVINSKASLYGSYWLTLGCLHQYGTMTNGYTYGKPIRAIYNNTSNSSKRVGVLGGYVSESSNISNVYSLVGVEFPKEDASITNDRNGGNLLGEVSRTVISNAYSYVTDSDRDYSLDPNFGTVSYANAKNVYYASSNNYRGNYSSKISKLALRDEKFQNKVLNDDKAFDVDTYVKYGYYPHIIWPDSMPNQEYIALPTVEDDDLIDITSVDSVTQKGETATVEMTVSNPGNERISNLSIKGISNKIVSQSTTNGKTALVIKVYDPDKYVSKYFIKSITSVGAYNIPYTRTYDDNERALDIDMYKLVSNVAEFKNIKQSLNENYMLTTDLDFKNATSIQLGNFSGKLNGDGHTIKNITLTSGGSVIGTLSGTVQNLYVENYTKTNKSYYGGLIDYASTNSIIDNVHMKNVNMTATTYIGGLVGYTNNSNITNSSVTNFEVNNLANTAEIRVGGLAGGINQTNVRNCYAQGVNLDLKDSDVVYAAGGLIGQISSGTVTSVYATGTIDTNSQEAGGITGRNLGRISNAYTNVDIYSQQDILGGIAGYSSNDYISNTLVVGDIYSYYQITENTHRTIGTRTAINSNYAWNNQKINGIVSSEINGDILVTTDELNTKDIYSTKIDIGNYFDTSGIGNNTLPLLYDTAGVTLLPNQEATKLKSSNFGVKNITISSGISSAVILLEIDNPSEYSIENLAIDGLKITEIKKNQTIDGITYLEINVTPERYYDSYMIKSLTYLKNGKETKYPMTTKIALRFYKDIEKFEDWQSISTTTLENYRLVADIDFSGKTNINTNVSINRLEGTDEGHTLKNIDLSFASAGQALIKTVAADINNVNFENINITNTGSGNYTGIIRFTMGKISNLNFTGITIDAPNISYTACISSDRSLSVRNISLEDVNVKGSSYTAGLIGQTRLYDMTYIDLKDVTVYGNGSYVGGMVGSREYTTQPTVFHITGDNLDVTGKGTYTGGIYGRGAGNEITVTNSKVTGVSYVGGISGNSYLGNMDSQMITNSTISGSGSNIGGITGYNYTANNLYVGNCEIYGTSTSTTSVGGISATGGYSINYSGIWDSKVNSLGPSVGGIKGTLSWANVSWSFVRNVDVSGSSYVGGAVGKSTSVSNTIYNVIVNANVTATGHGAGGIIGYIPNANTTDINNITRIYSSMVQNSSVAANYNAGGLIGIVDTSLYSGHLYNNFVSATIKTEKTDQSGIVIGNNDSYASEINNLKVYGNSKVNDSSASDILNGLGMGANVVTLSQMKTQSMYTSMGLSTGTFDYTPLSSDAYPTLKNVSYQEYISLPAEIMTFALRSKMVRGASVHTLPDVSIYASGINTINIEFSKVDPETEFTINGETKTITERVYTYEYDFVTDVVLELNDGINQQKVLKTSDDLAHTSSVNGDNYYYLNDGHLHLPSSTKYGNFVHLYKNEVLDENGNIYNLENNQTTTNVINNLKLQETKPLYEFYYQDYFIKTYAYFSIINETNEVEEQIFVKNNQVEIIDAPFENKKNMILLDSYNDNDYVVVLGNDGVLYSLKEEISLPDGFQNRNISTITSNISPESNLVFVTYEDGDYVCFDYRTGKVYTSQDEEKETPFAYFQARLMSLDEESTFDESYDESEKLVSKLEEKSVDEILTGVKKDDETKAESQEKDYATVYSPLRQSYVVYDLNNYLNTKVVESNSNSSASSSYIVDDKIYNEPVLQNYYYSDKIQKERQWNWIMVYLGIFSLIVISLLLLAFYLKKQNTKIV